MLAVAAEPRFCFGTRTSTAFALHKNGPNIMPASLQRLRVNSLNAFEITSESGEGFHAHHVLLLLMSPPSRSACSSETHNEIGFAIRQRGIICMADADPHQTSIETFTGTSVAKVQDYMISSRKNLVCVSSRRPQWMTTTTSASSSSARYGHLNN